MSDQKRRREDFYEIGYEILDTTRVQHGCCRRFDPGLRWYEANKHRTQSESPAALGPRGPAWQWEHSVLLPADGSVSVRQLTWLGQYSHAQPVAQTREYS